MYRFALGVAALASFTSVLADDCEFTKDLGFAEKASGLERLVVDAGSGKLEVVGTPGLDQIEVKAKACASSEKLLARLNLSQRSNGEQLMVTTDTDTSGWSWSGRQYASIHLEIAVPSSMGVEIDDGSGSLLVDGVAALVVDDGSGSMTIRNIGGDVTIDDGSGSIQVETVAGRVTVDDGSGSIDIDGVELGVFIEEDGSGGIDISNVVLNVQIDEDGSGDIKVRDVGGNVLVMNDASGGIKVQNITGDFEVGRDSNGGIDYDNVAGDITIPRDRVKRK